MVLKCDKDTDTVVLIMEVEDCFGVSIPDNDAEKIKTVGDLFDCVRQKVNVSDSAECLTAKAFYKLRRSLMHVTGWKRDSIRPDTQLDELLPKANRQRQWVELQEHLGLELPQLVIPWAVFSYSCLAVMLTIVGGLMGFVVGRHWIPAVLWPLAVVVILVVVRVTRPMAIIIPGCATVGDLARSFWAKQIRLPAEQGASDQQIWEAIINIIGESWGVSPSKITRELSFLRDFEGIL